MYVVLDFKNRVGLEKATQKFNNYNNGAGTSKLKFDLTQPHNFTGTLFQDFCSRVISQGEKKAYRTLLAEKYVVGSVF